MNPITKAHLEGVEMFEKKFGDTDVYPNDLIPKNDVMATREHIKRFLTTYAQNLLNAAKEAGPGEQDLGTYGDRDEHFRRKGINDCRSSFHQAIDEGIKEIRKTT